MSTHVRKLLLLLLLGITTNYIVGWTLVVQDASKRPSLVRSNVGFVDLGVERESNNNRPLRLQIDRLAAPGFVHLRFYSGIIVRCSVEDEWNPQLPALALVAGTPAQDAIERVLWDQTPFEDLAGAEWTMCGWPMLSMSTRRHTPPAFVAPTTLSVGTSFVPFPNAARQPRVYPLIPMWPGFAVNTGIWSAAWYLLLVGAPSFRAAWRLSRGRCTRCAYDLSSNTTGICPECGKPTAEVRADAHALARLIRWARPIERLREVSPARVAMFLLLGAVTSFLTSVAATLLNPLLADVVPPLATANGRAREGAGRARVSHSLGRSSNDLEYRGHLLRLLNLNELPDAQSQRLPFDVFIAMDRMPEFAPILASAEIPRGSALVRLSVVAAGWPMRAFTSSHAFASDGENITATHMHSVPVLPRIGEQDALQAPLAPITLGLVCDSVFWAVAWSLVPVAAQLIRPRRRSGGDAAAALQPSLIMPLVNKPAH